MFFGWGIYLNIKGCVCCKLLFFGYVFYYEIENYEVEIGGLGFD